MTVNTGVERLQSFVSWVKAHGAAGHIGEMGIGMDNQGWFEAYDKALAVMVENGLEHTYWGGGPFFQTYPSVPPLLPSLHSIDSPQPVCMSCGDGACLSHSHPFPHVLCLHRMGVDPTFVGGRIQDTRQMVHSLSQLPQHATHHPLCVHSLAVCYRRVPSPSLRLCCPNIRTPQLLWCISCLVLSRALSMPLLATSHWR